MDVDQDIVLRICPLSSVPIKKNIGQDKEEDIPDVFIVIVILGIG